MARLPQYRDALSLEQIAEGMNRALANASRLADDAQALFDQRRIPSAIALSILSIEESGKVSILRQISLADDLKELHIRSHTSQIDTFGTSIFYRVSLSMRLTRALRKALGNDCAIAHQHTSDARIRRRVIHRHCRQFQSTAHEGFVASAKHVRFAPQQNYCCQCRVIQHSR